MMLAPCNDVVKIVTSRDGGAGQKQQYFRQRICDPPWLPAIRKPREMLEKNGHPRPRHLLDKNCIHVRAPSRISAHREPRSYRQDKIRSFRGVNLSAPPWHEPPPILIVDRNDVDCILDGSGRIILDDDKVVVVHGARFRSEIMRDRKSVV